MIVYNATITCNCNYTQNRTALNLIVEEKIVCYIGEHKDVREISSDNENFTCLSEAGIRELLFVYCYVFKSTKMNSCSINFQACTRYQHQAPNFNHTNFWHGKTFAY